MQDPEEIPGAGVDCTCAETCWVYRVDIGDGSGASEEP